MKTDLQLSCKQMLGVITLVVLQRVSKVSFPRSVRGTCMSCLCVHFGRKQVVFCRHTYSPGGNCGDLTRPGRGHTDQELSQAIRPRPLHYTPDVMWPRKTNFLGVDNNQCILSLTYRAKETYMHK